ncbi:MAG: hypothetical protein ABI361_04375 [Nitrososphaera sp.]|jgi:hypothetical protein
MDRECATRTERAARRDFIPAYKRVGVVGSIFVTTLVFLFFYAHQAWSTGFFTESFGPLEYAFYGAIFCGLVGPLARAITGRRNTSRIPEIAASIFWILCSVWLLQVFPFDFSHFGDVLPSFMRFMVAWITNDIARVFLAIGIVATSIFAIVSAAIYLSVRKILLSSEAKNQGQVP